MRERRKARKATLEILYQSEIANVSIESILRDKLWWRGRDVSDFARRLIEGVEANRDRINQVITESTDNWALERMSVVDRNILRMAIYEILCEDDIPTSVSVNEAVELAKVYGSADSGKFVNGVLGRVAHDLGQEARASE